MKEFSKDSLTNNIEQGIKRGIRFTLRRRSGQLPTTS